MGSGGKKAFYICAQNYKQNNRCLQISRALINTYHCSSFQELPGSQNPTAAANILGTSNWLSLYIPELLL